MTHTPSINLRDHEARALLAGATQLWRPVNLDSLNEFHHVEYADDGMPIWFNSPVAAKAIRAADPSYFRRGFPCPYGKPGDVVLGREAFDWVAGSVAKFCGAEGVELKRFEHVSYRADGCKPASGRWTSAANMPAWAVRIKPVLASVRVRRAQEADAEDVDAMGLPEGQWSHVDSMRKFEFSQLWDEWHGPGSFAANRWCWCLEFQP